MHVLHSCIGYFSKNTVVYAGKKLTCTFRSRDIPRSFCQASDHPAGYIDLTLYLKPIMTHVLNGVAKQGPVAN